MGYNLKGLGFVLEEQTMALRTMFPSKARVGDTVHFSFAHDRFKGQIITAFDVVINGNKIADPELVKTNGKRKRIDQFCLQGGCAGNLSL
jgi:hypothetical protein